MMACTIMYNMVVEDERERERMISDMNTWETR
jgi:hypothetical protein